MSNLSLQILGNIGQDATVSEVNGRFCINFSVAHNRQFTDNDGVERKITTWVNCGFWKDDRKKTAIAQYLKAGTIVLVNGTPEVRQYKNKDGQIVSALQCNVSTIHLAGTAPGKNETASPQVSKEPVYETCNIPAANEDDLPF